MIWLFLFVIFFSSAALLCLVTASISHKNDHIEDEKPPSILTMTPPDDLLTGKWLNQWPIGNGKFGGLVGGSVEGDIIPLSMAGFYVIEGKPGPNQEATFLHQQFKQSREALVLGNFQESQKKMSNLVSKSPLGMFQYIGDLSLLFSPFPLVKKSTSTSSTATTTTNTGGRRIGNEGGVGRRKLWKIHNDIFKSPSHNEKVTFDKPQFSRQTLDTKSGITKSIFRISTKQVDITANSYQRIWFASAIDDVIVGKLQCRSERSTPKNPEEFTSSLNNCLHFSFRLSRFINKKEMLMPELGWNLQQYSSSSSSSSSPFSSSSKDILFGSYKIPPQNIYSFQFSLSPTPPVVHKDVEMCGVVICLPSTMSEIFLSNSPQDSKFLACNSIQEAHIILTIQSHDRNFTSKDPTKSSKQSKSLLEEKCWNVIKMALALGPSRLKKRHVQFFNSHASQSEVYLTSSSSPLSSSSSSSSTLKPTVPPPPSPSLSSQLTTLYWFNKYLLLSSSSRSVSNLQGLWSDGPWNPWNSDYHLNINLQMVYWPTFSLGLQDAIASPLIEFIQQISKSGHLTARQVYDSSGWVGHGFTDAYLDMGIRGDLQWALCVTCGSWLALFLWDHLTYTEFSLDFLLTTFLPIYRSMIEFYFDYLFEGPDHFIHTGPTTSPENSFTGYSKKLNRNIIQYLAFSPAIDMSILRQVANAYTLAIQWAYYHVTKEGDISIREKLNQHLRIAKKFTSQIRRMKNSANPLVSDSTHLILEYPVDSFPLTSTSSSSSSSSSASDNSIKIDESLDPGHRHFSSFHWLYPGLFQPEFTPTLVEAAQNTMMKKIQSGGGHTGWSAAWEVCLWSRLRQSSSVATSLKKLITRYFTSNHFGLHPKLSPNRQNCVTCYGPTPVSQSQASSGDLEHRGMLTKDSSVFQMDANSGMAAGLLEMLFQSHVPGVLLFLPALIPELPSGKVKNLLSRGRIKVNFHWSNNLIQQITLQIQSWHPWLLPQFEYTSGFFTTTTTATGTKNDVTENHLDISPMKIPTKENIVTLITPNTMKIFSTEPLHCGGEVTIPQESKRRAHISSSSDSSFQIIIRSFPCKIVLCEVNNSTNCEETL